MTLLEMACILKHFSKHVSKTKKCLQSPNLWSRSLPRGLPSPRAPPAPLALPLSLAQGLSQSSSRLTLVQSAWPSGLSVKSPRLIARFRLAAIPAPRPLPPALSSHGVRLVWLAAPLRPSRVLQILVPPRPLLGRQVRGVVPQAPQKHDNAGGTSTAAGRGRGAKFSVKHPRSVLCGLAAPTPRPTMTTTTRATPCCSCSPTPSSRPLHLRTSLTIM